MSDRPVSMANRFRGFMPVVIDVETGGFNARTDALLEMAAVFLEFDEDGILHPTRSLNWQVDPFPNANIEDASLEVNGIKPYNPLRMARPEEDCLREMFKEIRTEMKLGGCKRSILVGHNAAFDLGFIKSAAARCKINNSPLHPFSTFDTVSLSGLIYGQTVLARSCQAAGLGWNGDKAHGATYDTEQTARLFCEIINAWAPHYVGVQQPGAK